MFALGILGIVITIVIALIVLAESSSFGASFVTFILGCTLSVGFLYQGINGIHYQTGQGEHTGYVTASQTDGLFIKSTSIYFKTDTQSSQEDKYCLLDLTLLPKIKALQEQKKQITISYVEYFDNGMKCDTDDIIVGIK